MSSWQKFMEAESQKEYYKDLMEFLEKEYEKGVIFPPKEEIFKAFELTPIEKMKVLIIGQDPYHGYGQAHGLAFSVPDGIKAPRSLSNVFKELKEDLGVVKTAEDGNLTAWASQGVFLLNTVLTVREGSPNSHKNCGWEKFTDAAIKRVDAIKSPVAVVLWGKSAQKKRALFTNPAHTVFMSAHPSPLSASRGFFGSRPFSSINIFLKESSIDEIDWSL